MQSLLVLFFVLNKYSEDINNNRISSAAIFPHSNGLQPMKYEKEEEAQFPKEEADRNKKNKNRKE